MERWALFLFFVAFFIAAFVWRSWRVWHQTGINPYVLPSGDDAQGYIARAFRLVLLGVAGYAIAQAVWPDFDVHIANLAWLAHPTIHAAGWTILLLSLLWIGIAQFHMGTAWRIGLDEKNPTTLVSSGLFTLSRNPIFLGMRAGLLGLLLVRPNGLTLALGIAGELLMQLQVRHEEAFLLRQHGSAYREYCMRTRRWL